MYLIFSDLQCFYFDCHRAFSVFCFSLRLDLGENWELRLSVNEKLRIYSQFVVVKLFVILSWYEVALFLAFYSFLNEYCNSNLISNEPQWNFLIIPLKMLDSFVIMIEKIFDSHKKHRLRLRCDLIFETRMNTIKLSLLSFSMSKQQKRQKLINLQKFYIKISDISSF